MLTYENTARETSQGWIDDLEKYWRHKIWLRPNQIMNRAACPIMMMMTKSMYICVEGSDTRVWSVSRLR